MSIDDISLPDNLKGKLQIETIDYVIGDIIKDNANTCETDINGCKLDIVRTFYVTLSYKSGAYDAGNTRFSYVNINFLFAEASTYHVTYTGSDNTNSLPKSIQQNETLQVDFSNLKLRVGSVSIGGTTLPTGSYTYTNNILTIPNVTGDIIIDLIDVSDIEVVIDENTTVIAVPGISQENPVSIVNLFNMSADGENFSNKKITKIEVKIDYTTNTGGSNQKINIILNANGKTTTQTSTFQGGTSSTLTATFTGLNIGFKDTFTISTSRNKLTSASIDITGETVQVYFE